MLKEAHAESVGQLFTPFADHDNLVEAHRLPWLARPL
jgi:hypothetical protein